MTKGIFLFTLIVAISVTASTAQTKDTQRNSIISLHPFAFATGNFKLGFEQRLGEGATIKVMPSLGLADHSLFLNLDDYLGISIEGMLKYYPLKKSPNGFYGSVYLLYKYAEGTSNNTYYEYQTYPPYPSEPVISSGSVRAFGGGVCIGGEFNIKNVVFIDMYIGGGPIVPDSKYFFTDHSSGLGITGTQTQLYGFSRGICGHAGISFGIPLK